MRRTMIWESQQRFGFTESQEICRSHGRHHAGRCVVCGDVVCKVAARKLLDVLRRPQNGMAEWGVLEGCRVQVVEHHLLWNALHL